MSKKIRRILTTVNAALLACVLIAALAVLGALYIRPNDASARAENVAIAEADGRVVPYPEDSFMDYMGQYYQANTNYYKVLSIVNDKDEDVTVIGARNAGVYKITVSPIDGFIFENGENEWTYTLTINKIALLWTLGEQSTQEDVSEFEIRFAFPGTNYIDRVTATAFERVSGKVIVTYVHSHLPSDYNISVTKGGNVVNSAISVGRYEFAVTDGYNYTNPECTLDITPQEVNIGSSINLFWGSGGTTQLTSAEIFKYSYVKEGKAEVSMAYASRPLASAPLSGWNEWESEGSLNAVNSVVAYREGFEWTVSLNNSYNYYDVEYGGVTKAEESGEYVVTAKIKATGNYLLVYNPDSARADMKIEYNGREDCYEITKKWYVVLYFNSFISQSSADEERIVPYTRFAPDGGWAFGSFSESGVTLPCIEHGDEIRMYYLGKSDGQPSGFQLVVDGVSITVGYDMELSFSGENASDWESGDKDVVVFTLYDGEGNIICKDQPRSKFGYYFNDFMPVGAYSVVFTAKDVEFGSGGTHKHWWNGNYGGPTAQCSTIYSGVEISFEFEVYEAELEYDDSAFNFYGNSDPTTLYVNLSDIEFDYAAFFGAASGRLVSSALTLSSAKNSGTYWGEDGVAEKFFDSSVYMTFKFKGDEGDGYYGESDSVWDNLISRSAVGTYYLYYRIHAKNYVGAPAESQLETKYFRVCVYEVIDIPQLTPTQLRYTGEPQTVLPVTQDDRYEISENTAINVGAYKAKLTLSDPEHYRWRGVDGAVCEVDFAILKIVNDWLEDGTPAVSGGWKSGAFSATEHLFFAAAMDGVPVFSITTDELGNNFIEGLEAFTVNGNHEVSEEVAALLNSLKSGTYYLWCEVAETQNYTAVERVSFTFIIEPARVGNVESAMLTAVKILGVIAGVSVIIVVVIFAVKRKRGGGENEGGNTEKKADENSGEN